MHHRIEAGPVRLDGALGSVEKLAGMIGLVVYRCGADWVSIAVSRIMYSTQVEVQEFSDGLRGAHRVRDSKLANDIVARRSMRDSLL